LKEHVDLPSISKSVLQSKNVCNFILKNKELCKKVGSRTIISTKEDSFDEQQQDDPIIVEHLEELTKPDVETTQNFTIENYSLECKIEEKIDSEEIKNVDKKPEYEFNPSVLCPEEIRNGIHNCIKEDKITLYQYSVPIYEKPSVPIRRSESCDSCQAEPIATVETEATEEVSETNSKAEVDQEEEEEKNDCFLSDDNEKEGPPEEENPKPECIYDPFDPYPDFQFDISNVDTSLVGRLLKNVEPNFIWTWNKDAVSYKHLTKDQIVNRFPNAPFTTKVNIIL